MPKYYDLHVHSHPEGVDAPDKLVSMAKRYGYAGIVIANHSDHWSEFVGAISGVEIVATRTAELKKKIEEYRPKVEILLVHGGDVKINRAAVEDPRVDILAHPIGRNNEFNHILAKLAAKNDVAIEFNMDVLIHLRGNPRIYALSDFQHNLKLARKYDVPIILASNAMSCYDLRAPKEMVALASLFGMSEEEAILALSTTPMKIIETNRKRKSPEYVIEGVEIVK